MKYKEVGGPAFPQSSRPVYRATEQGTEVVCTGMTLRDWFAGQALVGMCANLDDALRAHRNKEPDIRVDVLVSELAYAIAGKMLKERSK